jgi:hypothetical protein
MQSFAKIINWALIGQMHEPHFKCVLDHSPSTGSDDEIQLQERSFNAPGA